MKTKRKTWLYQTCLVISAIVVVSVPTYLIAHYVHPALAFILVAPCALTLGDVVGRRGD
jgi:hypothetical protein